MKWIDMEEQPKEFLIVAETLRDNFLESLVEAESELQGFFLMSDFREIKNIITTGDGRKYISTSNLLRLNEALSECRIFAKECTELQKKFVLLNPFSVHFIQKMKRVLTEVKLMLRSDMQNHRSYSDMEEERKSVWEQESSAQYKLSLSGEPKAWGDGDSSVWRFGESRVWGFDEQADKIESLLFGGNVGGGITRIGIVGMAGAGKTTLAEMVLNRQKVKDEFCPIIRVDLHFLHFRKVDVQLSILRQILGLSEDQEESRTLGVGDLLEKLDQHLNGKRYLILLDDVWRPIFDGDSGHHQDSNQVLEKFGERLSQALPKGSGGVLIVTSRTKEGAGDMVGESNLVHVKPLGQESCYRIFRDGIPMKEIDGFIHEMLYKMKDDIGDECCGLPLAAETLARVVWSRIRQIKSQSAKEGVYIYDDLFAPALGLKQDAQIPGCPVFVFIDMKNKQLGERISDEFCSHLNKQQVYGVLKPNSDSEQEGIQGLAYQNPEMVLKKLYKDLELLRLQGHQIAHEILQNVKIIVVGEDAMAKWIWGFIHDLKLIELCRPSITVIPLQGENRMASAVSFGLISHCIEDESIALAVHMDTICRNVGTADRRKTDSWNIVARMKATESSASHQEISNSSHSFHSVEGNDHMEQAVSTPPYSGIFWNYFSLGVDAPRWYGASCFHPTARTIASLANVEVSKEPGQWELLSIPENIKSILCHNYLPSFFPERKDDVVEKEDPKRHLTDSFIDDGLLEIIGFEDVSVPENQNEQWVRLDQVRGIRFELIEGAAKVVNMRTDGAAWKKIPVAGLVEIIEISYHCPVNILALTNFPAKCIHEISPPSSSRITCESITEDKNSLFYVP